MDFIVESRDKLENWAKRNKKEIVKIMDAQYKIIFEKYYISITLTNIIIGDKIIHFVLDYYYVEGGWLRHKELESIEEVVIVLNSEIEKEKEAK